MYVARSYLGVKEIKGPKHNTVILGWLDDLGAWWREDESAWCGLLPAVSFRKAGYPIPKLYMRAKAWLDWGQRLTIPVYGCVVVFDRAGGGHVGFVVGVDPDGNPWVLGGNQGDAVTIAKFDKARVLGYRIPRGWPYSRADRPPVMTAAGDFSKNEA